MGGRPEGLATRLPIPHVFAIKNHGQFLRCPFAPTSPRKELIVILDEKCRVHLVYEFVVGSVILGDCFYFDAFGVSPILRASARLAGDIEPNQIPITANLYQYANEEWDLGL